MSDVRVQRFLRVSTNVCHSDDKDCDSTGPAVDYKLVTTQTLLLLAVW